MIVGGIYAVLIAAYVIVFHAVTGVPVEDILDGEGTIYRGLVGALITAYLLKNVQRLTAEGGHR